MWFIEPDIGLPVVALLVSYLLIKHFQRIHTESSERVLWKRCSASFWDRTGAAADLTKVNSKIETLRRDYLAAIPPARGAGFHRALLGMTRKMVARLAYFEDKDHASEAGP